jgi:hypothetical protein
LFIFSFANAIAAFNSSETIAIAHQSLFETSIVSTATPSKKATYFSDSLILLNFLENSLQ